MKGAAPLSLRLDDPRPPQHPPHAETRERCNEGERQCVVGQQARHEHARDARGQERAHGLRVDDPASEGFDFELPRRFGSKVSICDMPPPSQMKMQCSALPLGVFTAVVLAARSGEAPMAAAEVRKERRFMMVCAQIARARSTLAGDATHELKK